MNYEHVFDDIFEKYTKYNHLTKVKTSDMGTMFVLNFEIILKRGVSSKEFIDEIRQRNGNLNVILTVKKYTSLDEFRRAKLEDIIDIIKPIGTYNKKAKNIMEISKKLEVFNDTIPNDRKFLESLPGVGRKTTNVVLSVLFNEVC